MRKTDFLFICNENNILPSIVLEDKNVIKIIKESKGKQNTVFYELKLNTYIQNNF
jgi:hypothetical protein